GEVALKDEVAAVLNLTDRIKTMKVHGQSFPLGEFRSKQKSPVVKPLTDELWGQSVRSALKGLGIRSGKKSVVVLTQAHPSAVELDLNEIMAIKPIGGVKGQKGGYPHHHRSQQLVSDIEVVVGKADSFLAHNSVVGVCSWKLGLVGAKASTVFHALEDEIDIVKLFLLHAVQERLDKLFLAHPLLRPLHRNIMVTGKGFHPTLVVVSPLGQHLFGDHRLSHNLAEKVHDVLRAR